MGFDPVVAFVSKQSVCTLSSHDKVVAGSSSNLGSVWAGHYEILARSSEDQRHATAAVDDVVALIAVQHVDFADVRARVRNDVVAFATMYAIYPVAGFNAVVAGTAPYRVITLARNDVVVIVSAHDDDMFVTVVA